MAEDNNKMISQLPKIRDNLRKEKKHNWQRINGNASRDSNVIHIFERNTSRFRTRDARKS